MIRNIWLDDVRTPPEGFIWCKNYDSAISAFDEGEVGLVSFDHDLGENKSGYDVAKYIVENQISIEGFRVHSMNPVGAFNIRQLLAHYGYREVI